MQPEDVRTIPVSQIPIEGGALKMLSKPEIQPYLAHAEAAITGQGCDEATSAIAELPLERRYIWRIASSLKQAFCDFDKSSVRADLGTMNAEDFDNVLGLIERRPVQFAMLLRTVFGAEQMESMLLDAIDIAKR
jgi:hypothetical protein